MSLATLPCQPPSRTARSHPHPLVTQIRPGSGGEEAALFAMDLWGMYQKFAALRGWRFEIMHLALTETGGCKHGSAAISGTWGRRPLAGSVYRARCLSRS